MRLPPWPLLILCLVLVLVALDRLLFWLARRGWIYYRNNKPKSSGRTVVRGVLSTFQEIVQPEIRYVKEDRDQRQSQSGQEDPSDR